MDSSENVSYIIIHDLSPEARILYLSPSLTDVLGFDPDDTMGTSSFDWIHPDEVEAARQLHYETIRDDKAAAVAYLRVKNQADRWVGVVIQRSVVHNALIGSLSFAKPGAKAMHTAATAQEVAFLNPAAYQTQLEFRKWNDPKPKASIVNPRDMSVPFETLFNDIPIPSERTGLILNRYSRLCTIMYCTNNCIFDPLKLRNRSLYDFVHPEDEANVRQCIDVSKGWGVSDSGHPSDGGFVFGSFRTCLSGRDSSDGKRSAVSNNIIDPSDIVRLEAIFSAHSDGFIVIVRKAQDL